MQAMRLTEPTPDFGSRSVCFVSYTKKRHYLAKKKKKKLSLFLFLPKNVIYVHMYVQYNNKYGWEKEGIPDRPRLRKVRILVGGERKKKKERLGLQLGSRAKWKTFACIK